jgi:type I restriction enzyme S subunit
MTVDGTIVLEGTKSVPASPNQCAKYHLEPLDLLFNNTNSPEMVGKVALFHLRGTFVYSNHLTRVRLDRDQILPQFLQRHLFHLWQRGFFKNLCTQWVNQAAISVDALAQIGVPLPALPEQRHIVQILDAAEELRRLRAHADRRTADLIPAIFYEMFGDPARNPKRWQVTRLGELILDGPQNGLYKHVSAYGEGPPILRINSFYDGEVVKIEELLHVKLSADEITLYRLRENDIVINRVNSPAYLGKSALIPAMKEPTVFESNMMRFSVNLARVVPRFLIAYLQTEAVREQIRAKAKHAIHQSSINQQDVKAFTVPLPPVSLQRQFAARVAEIRALEARQAESRRRLDELFQSLLHRAFRGELWPHPAGAAAESPLLSRGTRSSLPI